MCATSFFSRILGLVILCLSLNFATAQVQQIQSYTTSNEYEIAAVSGLDGSTVVAFQKPGNQIRMSSFQVSTAGNVTLKDNLDISDATKVNVAMLSSTRAILASRWGGKIKVTVFDISATGNISQKGTWTGADIKSYKPGIVRLNNSSFAIGVALSSGDMRLTTFTVNAAGTLTKKDDENGGTIEQIDLANMSAERFVAGVRLAGDQLKVICFDVHSDTKVITRRGDHQFTGAVKRISMVRHSATVLAAFFTDSNSKLGLRNFTLTNSGNFIVADTDLEIKKPGTNTVYQLKEIDGQRLSGDKILLSAVTSNNLHVVVPFKMQADNNLNVQSGQFNSSAQFNLTYSTIAAGKFVACSRQMNNKYKVAAFNW